MLGPIQQGIPPQDCPISFAASEWGCDPRWYLGFCSQSSLPGQELKFYIFPFALGYDPRYPFFGAPPYQGVYCHIVHEKLLEFIEKTYVGIRRHETGLSADHEQQLSLFNQL